MHVLTELHVFEVLRRSTSVAGRAVDWTRPLHATRSTRLAAKKTGDTVTVTHESRPKTNNDSGDGLSATDEALELWSLVACCDLHRCEY